MASRRRAPNPVTTPRRKRRVTPSQIVLNRTPTPQSALTRTRVVEAAIACLAGEGFHRASTTRIAERVGLTWGVLQYHFGDKQGILAAVLDRSFDDFRTHLEAVAGVGGTVRARVERLVDVVWELIGRPSYRANMEILRNVVHQSDSSIDAPRLLAAWKREIADLWEAMFPEMIDRHRQSETARRLLFATLRGLADEHHIEGRGLGHPAPERDALVEAVTYLVEPASADRARVAADRRRRRRVA